MEASIIDLRYKMKEILKALEKNEEVTILYHGKEKGKIIPSKSVSNRKTKDHPFFGMRRKARKSVEAVMKDLRGDRCAPL